MDDYSQASAKVPVRSTYDLEEAIAPANGKLPQDLRRLKAQLHHQLITGLDVSVARELNRDQLRAEVRRVADELCQRSASLLNRQEREAVYLRD